MYYLEYMGERPVNTNWRYMEPINKESCSGEHAFVQVTVGSRPRDELFRGANAAFCIDSSGNRLFG